MSFQTIVLEDGRWVTRNLDQYHVQAQGVRREEENMSSVSADPAKAPSVGFLTRTLVGSSVIKQIIPARIRHETKNDVVFVSADSVTINEASDNYTVKSRIIKNDFDSPIRMARIFGCAREPEKEGIHTPSVTNERELETDKWSLEPVEESNVFDSPSSSGDLPPHILALALESNKLVFFCSRNGTSDQPRLLWSQHPMPVIRPNEQMGEHLAIDPYSRAMAVAAHEGAVGIYGMKTMDVLNKEVRDGLGLHPIREERFLRVDGIIIRMDFLHPSPNDRGHIILVLITHQNDKAIILWYEWTSGSKLHECQMQAKRHILPREEWALASSLLLIPLMNSTAFAIVSERRITVYIDILTGNPSHSREILDVREEPEERGFSKRIPMWAQWARSFRSEHAIYLCREDGVLQYLEFSNKATQILVANHQSGRLDTNVDTAFATIDLSPDSDDLLVVGCSTGEGGLWRMLASKDPCRVDVMTSWTPLIDFTAISLCDTWRRRSISSSPRERLFACTGQGKPGAISELRYGCRASEMLPAETKIVDGVMGSGVLGIWAFHGSFDDSRQQYGGPERMTDLTYILLSYPMQTSLLRIRFETLQHESNVCPQFAVEEVNLDLPARTIFASTTTKGLLVHITETAIMVSSLSAHDIKMEGSDDIDMMDCDSDEGALTTMSCFQLPNSGAKYLAASVHHGLEKSTLLVVVQVNGNSSLQLGYLDTNYEPSGEPLQMQSQPTCVQLQIIEHRLLAFVATLDCKLHIFQIDDGRIIPTRAESHTFDGHFANCDSIAVINSIERPGAHSKCFVICGLRNGSVQTLRYSGDAYHEQLTFCEENMIGTTSVNVIADFQRKSRVFLHCERTLCTLEYRQCNNFSAPTQINSIWISDKNQLALQQGTISAFTQIVNSWRPQGNPGLAFGSLLCIDGNRLHMASLDESSPPQVVPCRLQIRGAPEKIIYSTYLNRLIVLSNFITVHNPRRAKSSTISRQTRVSQPIITFLDPDDTTGVKLDADDMLVKPESLPEFSHGITSLFRRPTEHFIGITEWFPKVAGKNFHMLIINTRLTKNSKPAGRLLIFNIRSGSNEDIKLELKKTVDLEAPAYSVTQYPDHMSFVYCTGKELRMLSLVENSMEIKLRPPVKAAMRSPGRSLSIREPYIYVSTARESLLVFKYTDDKLVYQFGDNIAREGLHHVHIPNYSLVLASDMRRSVVGLWQPSERRVDNTMSTVFEAILPTSITHLQEVTPPIWYSNPADSSQDQAIIGTSEDGRITQFTLLFQGWRLLRFIQNMAERNEVVCPFNYQGPYKRHIDPSTSKPHYMHVNGDILQRVVDRGGEQLIKEMLDVEPDLESHIDFDSVSARWERFRELASEVVPISDPEWLAMVVQWMRYRLRSVL